ncbi:hypothetical protein [Thalassovita sp.]|jgi:hypothetical protein|uniref:hypothetical protein n=1 Tax=Thalassovita sp. TaxID=1979401 RepID=UPI003B5CE6C2
MVKRASSIALSFGAVAVAIGSGYFMENSAPTVSSNIMPSPILVAAMPPADPQPAPQSDLRNVELTASPLPEIPADIFQELNMPSQGIQRVAVTEKEIVVPQPVEVQGGFSCSIEMTAEPTIAAMVNIEIRSACLPGTRVTLHHNGLMITEMTDDQGELFLTMPALSETSVFIADFGQDNSAITTVQVPSLRFYDRAVVQWQGVASLHLHALEFGAQFGEDGHIWDQHTGDLEKTIHGESGFLSLIGDPALPEGMQAQVYTFPSGTTSRVGDIQLEIEAEVTDATCGREISAQSLQISEASVPRVQELQLTMPDCDAIGDFLVLKNVLEDLKVAAK